MRYGDFINNNGTIGFIAPAFGCTTEPYKSAFQNALYTWQAMGYRTALGPNVYKEDGIGTSTDPAACGREIMDWYLSKQNDALISCGGGELMCEDLASVDFEQLAEADPKWFMGYSDNTNLVFLLATLCDTAAVYGPYAPAFGMEPWHPALSDAFGILTGEKAVMQNGISAITVQGYDRFERTPAKDEAHPLLPYNVTEPVMRRGFPEAAGRPLAAEGRLLGGCLDVLVTLIGTKYDRVREFAQRYKEDGILWFFEACDLGMIAIRRAVWQMREAGWFENCRGILVGRPWHYGEEVFGMDRFEAVMGIVEDLHVPVFMDLDIGHLPPMMPLVVGSRAKARLVDNDFHIEMELRP